MTDPAARLAPGWVFAVLTVALAGPAALLSVDTVHTVSRVAGERPGTITVSLCVFDKYGTHETIYRCDGDFAARDGSFATHDVAFHHAGRLAPGDRVAGIVSGPGDRTADVESRWEIGVKLAATLASAAALAGVLVLWRRVRRLRAAGTKSPAR
ncbi:hypothetical protein [Actinomadura sp. DC4]|uniref:hypothetical protein n=1 Tax=Actinomadura sp. DC4 TaxID=3055069 RepID=UPI0025AF9B8F|nr:hypothetical protein [Actinomadura sp. DC4]MDN3354231.1 hypothetical protein [Actinomadura sp. DC4]